LTSSPILLLVPALLAEALEAAADPLPEPLAGGVNGGNPLFEIVAFMDRFSLRGVALYVSDRHGAEKL
jgi:hypothetical protein